MNNQKVEHGIKTKGWVQSLGMELIGSSAYRMFHTKDICLLV